MRSSQEYRRDIPEIVQVLSHRHWCAGGEDITPRNYMLRQSSLTERSGKGFRADL